MLDRQTTQKLPPLNGAKRDIMVAALPFAVALMENLPAHVVPQPLLRSDTEDLFLELGGDEKLIARARKHVSKNLQPVKAAQSTL
jgi:hypothetical protein